MSGWLTTTLIFLPVAAALLLWLVPWPRAWVGSLATLVVLTEVGLWIVALLDYDFSAGLQGEHRHEWFADLGVSYHVGLYPFSLWLVGLTVVAGAAAIAYAWWVGRDRPRAYFGLMLFLVGAVVGVFTAQDLILFYAFFEAMLIPLYVLIGVWGGPGRTRATFQFVIYTMAGSLLMLAAIVVFGLREGTFDLVDSGTSDSVWLFLGFAIAFAVKAPLFPFHGWLPDAYRESPPEVSALLSGVISKVGVYVLVRFAVAFAVKAPLFPFHGWLPDAYRESPPEVSALLSGVVSKVGVYGMLRIAIAKFPEPADDFQVALLALAAAGLVYGSLLAFRASDVRGVIAYSSLAQMGLITLGLFAFNDQGYDGAVLQMVVHGLLSTMLFLLAGGIERRTSTGELILLGGLARGRPALATVLMTTGIVALAVPGSAAFAGEFLILLGVFDAGWAWAAVGALAIVLAAMYMLRLISAVLHEEPGSAVSDAALDLRPAELGILVPLLACVLALSAWPAAISERAFPGDDAVRAVEAQFR